jgi:hypothetical protein
MRIRLVLCISAILALGGIALAFAQETNPPDLLKTADEMIRITARLRGLEPKSPILRAIKSRDEISRYLNEKLQKESTDREILEEQIFLRTLGLIPSSLDLKASALKMLTERIEGVYDPEKKTLFLVSGIPAAEQNPVIIHELDHALQDQYFDLGKILNEDRHLENDDKVMAHKAVIEGEALVIMMLEASKRTFSQLPDLAVVSQLLNNASEVPGNTPMYLQETLQFPYGYGAAFLQKIWLKNPSWESINKIYSDLPSSTEQILHPEKYYGDRDEPKPVNAEAIAGKLGSTWKVTYKNVLGEFSLDLLLRLYLTEQRSRRAAAGWGGDQVLLLENAAGNNAVLADTVWDSPEEGEKFFNAMQAWFQQKFPNARKADETTAGFSLTEDKQINWLRRDGAEVQFLIGLPESDAPLVRDPKFWIKN